MSNLDTSLDRAHKVKGPEQAARLYADIDTELGLGEYTEDQADTGERALRHLEENYPGVRSNSFAKVENGHLPNLSRSAKGNLDREAGEPREESENAHPKEEGWGPELERDRRRRRAANRTRVTRARSQPRRARRVGRTIYQGTRAAGAVESTTQLILKALGGLAGISFLYLLLQPKGVAAIQTGAGGVNHALSALISPSVDPLRSTTADIANAGYAAVQNAIGNASSSNVFDTPTGPAPFVPPTNLPGSNGSAAGSTPGTFDTPGAVAPYKPPTNLPNAVTLK